MGKMKVQAAQSVFWYFSKTSGYWLPNRWLWCPYKASSTVHFASLLFLAHPPYFWFRLVSTFRSPYTTHLPASPLKSRRSSQLIRLRSDNPFLWWRRIRRTGLLTTFVALLNMLPPDASSPCSKVRLIFINHFIISNLLSTDIDLYITRT